MDVNWDGGSFLFSVLDGLSVSFLVQVILGTSEEFGV